MSTTLTRATVIGDGAMGTLCALLLAEHGTEVTLWGSFPEQIAQIKSARENRRFLPGHKLLDSIHPVSDREAAFAGAELIVSAIPCQFLREVWNGVAKYAPKGIPIVSVTKGIEVNTLALPLTILTECVKDAPMACLSGPSIAPEVADRKPAGVVVASRDAELAELVQTVFSTRYFRVYTSDDPLGVEIAGAAKNVIALAAGICDGIGAGDNAKASLLARGLVEITRLGVAMNACPETFRGLAGVGDLFTTCVSKVGRNRSAGERIGRGATAQEAIQATESVIEGIPTTRSVLDLARRCEIEMPIAQAVADVLFHDRRPADAIDALMTRTLRREQSW